MTKIQNGPGLIHRPRSNAMQWSSVCDQSSDAIAKILHLHFPTGSILDVNFGLGVFYRRTEREVTGVDTCPPPAMQRPEQVGYIYQIQCDNRNLPFEADSFDVGVCDPPYKRGDGVKYEARYGKAPKTETQVTWSYYDTLTELLRVVRHGVIIKVQDGTDGHRFHARHFMVMNWMKEKTGLEPHDIAHTSRKSLAPTMVQGTPHFFQQGVSYFLIYRWTAKNPYRPIRF